MITRTFSILAISAGFSLASHAAPSLNEISTCQAMIAFVAEKTRGLEDKYGAANVKTVNSALTKYGTFLQSEHMAPGLLSFNGGDAAKTRDMQAAIEEYQDTVKAGLAQKYAQPRLFSDHAVMINDCYKTAPMGAQETAMMTSAVETLINMAQQK